MASLPTERNRSEQIDRDAIRITQDTMQNVYLKRNDVLPTS
jgi:hypothetical protein